MTEQPEFLADPAELAAVVGRPANDPLVLARLRASTRRFRGQVGHPVTLVADDVVILNGNGRQSLLLPVWPVTAVSQVLLDGEELTEHTDYDWAEQGLLRRLRGRLWPDRLRCLQVTNSHGWAVVPSDVTEAVLDQAEAMFNIRPGIASMTTGGQSISYGTQAAVGATDTWARAVARHRIRTSGDA